jgi:hypothetical protein
MYGIQASGPLLCSKKKNNCNPVNVSKDLNFALIKQDDEYMTLRKKLQPFPYFKRKHHTNDGTNMIEYKRITQQEQSCMHGNGVS